MQAAAVCASHPRIYIKYSKSLHGCACLCWHSCFSKANAEGNSFSVISFRFSVKTPRVVFSVFSRPLSFSCFNPVHHANTVSVSCALSRPGPDPITPFRLTVGFLPPFSPPTEVPVSSVLCLSSVRELPVQVRDLYAQGFVLVAVHPFVHPCGPRHAHIQRQLHRAVLVRETPRYPSTHILDTLLRMNLQIPSSKRSGRKGATTLMIF